MIGVGVQTWGTDVATLRRYWAAADTHGYARVTYGDGLWSWTHDGWTLLAALALQTERCRIGPAVTYAFDDAAHHVSWLAKRAVAVDHLSQGRLDLRLAVGAEAPGVAESWRRRGIAYPPPPRERLLRLEATIDAVRRLWAGESVTSPLLGLRDARVAPAPLQRPGPPVWAGSHAIPRHRPGRALRRRLGNLIREPGLGSPRPHRASRRHSRRRGDRATRCGAPSSWTR